MKKRIFAITMIIIFGCLPIGCGTTASDKNTLFSSESVLSDDETEKNHENVEEVEKRTDIELTDIRWDEENAVYEVEYIDLDGAAQSGTMDFEGNIDTTKEEDYQGEGIVLDCYRGRFLVEIEHSSIDELYYEVAVCDETGFVLASTTVESQPVPGEYGHINENMFWFNFFESNYYSESGLRDTYLLNTESYDSDPIYLGCGVERMRIENNQLFFKYNTQYGYDAFAATVSFQGSGFSWDENEFSTGDDYIGAVSSGYFLQKSDSLYKYDWEGNETWCFDQYPIRVLDVSEAGIGCALSGKDGNTYITCLDIETGEMKYEPIQTVDTTAVDLTGSFTYNDTYSYKQYYTWNEKQEDNDKFIHYSINLLTGETVCEIETQDAFLSEDCRGGIFLFSDTDLSDLYNFAGEKIIPKASDFKNSYLKVDKNTVEDYSANLNPDEYFHYKCPEFDFYYPANLYHSWEIYHHNEELVAGLSELTIDLFGDELSVLSIQVYKRIDDDTNENFMQFLYEGYSDGYENVKQISYSEEKGSFYYSGYFEKYLRYDYVKITDDKVYRLFISVPIEDNLSDEDLQQREYVVENIYRMCSFTDSEEDVRTYEQFLSEQQ